MDELLQKFVKEGPTGCACAVAKKNEVLYENYFGYADMEQKRPVDKDTLFRLFSMTKPIICTAAMMLFERGKFLLNDPLYEYFPEYKDTTVVVTDGNGMPHIEKAKNTMLVKHAFSMAVGMPYPFGTSVTAQEMAKVKKELTDKYGKYDIVTEVKAMGKVPVAFEPGTHWLYGYGHDIVAGLIQLVSGKTVGEFLKEEIFEPLGMNNTAYRYHDNNQERMVTFCLLFHFSK
jgi:CubicO group peptidase (beta-lactamase class C family)